MSGTATVRIQKGAFSIRWNAELAEAARREGHWVNQTLADALQQSVAQQPQRVVLVDGDMRLDCATLQARAKVLAETLLTRFAPGSVVSFMLPNWHEASVIYLAITLAGMVAHPLLPSLREHELEFQLHDVDSQLVFIPATFRRHDYVAMLDKVVQGLQRPPQVVVVRGNAGSHLAYDRLFTPQPQPQRLPDLDPDAVRLVMYTSGTTGTSKGVLHTHNTLYALIRQIGQHWLVARGDSFLVPSPISHIGGSIYAFEAPLLLGTTAVLMDRWEAQAGLKLAATERCTHICGATPFLEQLLEAARASDEHLPHLKLFVCGGASVPPAIIRDAATHFSHSAVTRVYGSTEVPVTTVGCPSRADIDNAAQTDGRAGIARIKLVGSARGVQGDGEVVVRGPQMLVGYVHQQDEAQVFDADGYYRTGDLGHLTAQGCLVISGRSKDIIIRHGENIAPKEIEDVLLQHPAIAEVAVVGVPDPRTGERTCAVVVPAESAASLDVAALAAFLGQRGVAAFKFPEQVERWTTLPRNEAGKVLKHVIRTSLTDAGQAAKNKGNA